jgi:very-short-patch-repair endonuclease
VRGKQITRTERSRRLRRNATRAELALWNHVRDRQLNGLKFVRQQFIAGYYVDFVCREHRLIIEIDGGQHADNAADQKRDAVLASLGYRVIRFWNNEVLANIEGVLQHLAESASDSPSP